MLHKKKHISSEKKLPGNGKDKIGIGVITYNRPQFFQECIASIPDADAIVVVNDGDSYPAALYPSRVAHVIQHKNNIGVGRSKNQALRFLLDSGCSHIFLCEDDIRIVNPHICREYVRASEVSGILHFNFAYHGSENKLAGGHPAPPRKTAAYEGNISIGMHRHLLAAFQYFHRDVLLSCGFFDPVFKNMLEHIDHTYRIIKKEYHPPFWWFADLEESFRYIADLDPEHAYSTIRSRRWTHRTRERLNALYFTLKHGSRLWHIPDPGEAEVDRILLRLQKMHARKIQRGDQ